MGIRLDNGLPPKSDAKFGDFCGGWGSASFTLASLVQRARAGMARFSEKIEGYPWIKWLGATVYLVPNNEVDYLFSWDSHRPPTQEEKAKEERWCHPGVLLNLPWTRTVESIRRTKCCKWKRIRIKPPPLFEGWYDKEQFAKYILGSYLWTTIDMSNPMGLAPVANTGKIVTEGATGLLFENKWFTECAKNGQFATRPTWIDRTTYDTQFLKSETDITEWLNWQLKGEVPNKPKFGPFCPPVLPTQDPQTLWIKYTFRFKVGGASFQNFFPNYPISEVEAPPGPCTGDCTACIRSEDLDSTGILKDGALRRITKPDHSHKLQYLRRRIIDTIRKKLKARTKKSVKWWDQ